MARRKRQSSAAPAKTSGPHAPKHRGLYAAVIITLMLGGIPFALGKYIELNSPGPFDSGAYVYSAKHLLEGARLGIEEQSSAQPNTLIANIVGVKLFGFNDTGPKIVQMMLQIAAGIFMFYTLRRVFGTVAAVVGTTVAAVYLSAPVIAKFGNVKEQFMIAFMLYAACCFLLYEITQKRFWLLLSGFFALQPYYFKATGITIVIAIVLYMLIKNTAAKQGKPLIAQLLVFLAGYGGGLIVPLSLFVWQKQPGHILHTFPVFALISGLFFAAVLWIILYIAPSMLQWSRRIPFSQVSWKIWVTGLILIIFAVGVSVRLIQRTEGYQTGDVGSYIRSIPIVSIPSKAVSLIRNKLVDASGLGSGYLAASRAAIDTAELAKKIGRYYMALKVPILLALVSILPAAIVWLSKLVRKTPPQAIQSKVVWLLAVWWMLDMAFIWISPRSYEQYYLPLCASAAMLGGFAVWKWYQKLTAAQNKMPWLAAGTGFFILLAILSIPIFAGFKTSPDTGAEYGQRNRGFAQALNRVNKNYQQPWQMVGDHIRQHTAEDDTIYVWGWVPGIYVQAGRLAPVPAAFESDMHIKNPNRLKGQIASLVEQMKLAPPAFIVDTRKRHIPWNRPPLELWPIVPPKLFGNQNPRFLKNDPQEITAFNAWYANQLETNINEQEAMRYEAMEPFREFVMNHYRPVVRREFGSHQLFQRVTNTRPQP